MDEIKEIEGKLKLVREATGLNNLQYCKTHKTIILPFMEHYPCCLLSKVKELEEGIEKHRRDTWGYGEDVNGEMWQVGNDIDQELYKLIEKEE